LVHVAANDKGVGGRPRFGFVTQKRKFQRQLILVVLDKSVYSTSISLDDCASFTGDCRRLTFGCTAEAQSAKLFVD